IFIFNLIAMKLKRTIISRDIKHYVLNAEIIQSHQMQAGDLAVFEVVELGKHENSQMEDGRNRSIFPGDQMVAAFADRYATAQFEGYVPEGPTPDNMYEILGAGGVIGLVKSKNWTLKDVEPTTVRLVGYCCDERGKVINTKFYRKKRSAFRSEAPCKVILSIGSTMDSGKTTTAAYTARGLAKSGYKVAFIKLTGTCYTRDREFVLDCGAHLVTDFSDLGYPSTYMSSKKEILDIYQSLLDRLAPENLDFIVMEIADGLMQRETMFLLKDPAFMRTIHRTIFSCGDSLSAFYGVQLLNNWGIEVSAISGRFTMSPLLIQEVRQHQEVPVFTIYEVSNGAFNYLFTDDVRPEVPQQVLELSV
ncbi:MAG: hypothetical protein ABIQ93_11180, partial [Saprospiraceae bacterium]